MQVFNQRGLSMIEITMAMGLLGGLAVAGMQLMKNQSEAQKTIEKKYESVTVLSSIRSLLSDPSNCTETFRGKDPSSNVPTLLKKKGLISYDDVYAVGSLQPGGIKIESYLMNVAYPGLASNEAVLRVGFNLGKAALREKSQGIIKINYTLNPSTNMIATCYALNQNSDTLWEKAADDPHNIFYNGGSVGIGLTSPTAMLTVNGSIKIGQTSATCDASSEGELRYDAASHKLQFCNGTTWAVVGGQVIPVVPNETIACAGGSGIVQTAMDCQAGLSVRSCGIRLTTQTMDPDGISCTIDPVLNKCIGIRNQAGACDPDVELECFCQ